MVPGPDTVFFNQTQLLPGHYLLYKNNKLTTNRYWTIDFYENENRSFAPKKDQFLSLLRESLIQENGTQNVGTFLSGGTDSSTVTGILSELVDHPVKTFSIGFDAEGYDESYYSRLVSKHFNTDHHEYYVTPNDVLEAVQIIARTYDKPFGNSSAIPTYYCAKLAEDNGITKLLAGDGGDELFGGNSRYAKQQVFSHYAKVPSPLRNLLENVVINQNIVKNSGIARKLSRYIEQSKVPMPDRLESYNLINFIGAETIFEKEFLSHVDQSAPIQMLRNTYRISDGYSLINRMLALDMYYTLSENDIPKVTNMCHQAHIDVGFPLLNDDLVNFSLHLPPRDKLRGQKLRYFFKKALSDLLPGEVISKKKHGFGLPFGVWLNSYKPLREMSMDSISDLKKRKIIKPEFIDRITGDYLSEHASYYGTLIWVLLILEQWLKHHGFSVKF
jgi:asparagine synthase (glutamine-hydrolysing)